MKCFFFAIGCWLALSGCAVTSHIKTGNQLLTAENANKIHKGMTKEQVAQILGKPYSIIENSILGDMWTYACSDMTQSRSLNPVNPVVVGGSARSMGISFDQSGKVKTITKSENDLFQPMTVQY